LFSSDSELVATLKWYFLNTLFDGLRLNML